MPKKKVEEMPKFVDALREVADAKGLSDEQVITALEEAIQRAYIKYLGGGDDAVVSCHVDPETGHVDLAQIKKVVEEVQDDYLEISVEDANATVKGKKSKYAPGDDFAIPCPLEQVTKLTAMAVKSNLRQRLAEAERTALYEVYKDHIGEMMTGTVVKADDRGVTIRIGRTYIEMGRRELIGDEYFKIDEPVKVYIQEVRSVLNEEGKPAKGPQIEATRASEGFLKRLFEEEIHEIYEGTVVIKAIARQAGVRSKVAVASNNEDVDATGACIGQGGQRIQKIVAQLGNGKNKEKIDVVNYSDNHGLFIIEAVRPVTPLGVAINEEEKTAIVVINDGDLPLAMGKFRANVNLASKLTGYKLEMLEKSIADRKGITYTTVEEWKAMAEEERRAKEKEEYLNQVRLEAEHKAEEEAAEEARKAAEETAAKEEAAAKVATENAAEAAPVAEEKPVVAPKAAASVEDFPAEAVNPAAAALAAFKAAEAKKAEEAAAPKKEETVETAEVKTTTTLSDLEKELESAKEKKTRSVTKKRPRKITEEEVKRETPVAPVAPNQSAMPVYTEEELADIEAEEKNYDSYEGDTEEDIDEDYSEYDQYYDDDK